MKTKTSYCNNKRSVTSKWPIPNLERIEGIINDGPKLVDIWDLSPIQRTTDAPNTDVILSLRFDVSNTGTWSLASGRPAQFLFAPHSKASRMRPPHDVGDASIV